MKENWYVITDYLHEDAKAIFVSNFEIDNQVYSFPSVFPDKVGRKNFIGVWKIKTLKK